MIIEMLRDYRWCSPWNFIRLFSAAHYRKKNSICPIRLRIREFPVYVRARTSDCFLVRTVLTKLGGEYPVFKDYQPRVIIDAGANVGFAHIDILKLDIEGNERELFQRNTEWLAITDNIFMELHDHVSPGASRQVLRAIADQGFSLRFRGKNLILMKQAALQESITRQAAPDRRPP